MTTIPTGPSRLEEDALGTRQVPDDIAYGIQTLKAIENFSISGRTIADIEGFVPATIQIKKAAAIANRRAGELDPARSAAIENVATEQLRALSRADYPADIYHGGGGTAANMNVNEVLANLASDKLTGRRGPEPVHPNTHVNMAQSTNDVIPSAMKMAIGGKLASLRDALNYLVTALLEKERRFADVVKLARICLQDAMPVTFAQQFSGYRAAFQRQSHDLEVLEQACLALPLGATAVGTGFGSSAAYRKFVFEALHALTGQPFRQEENLFDALAGGVQARLSGNHP